MNCVNEMVTADGCCANCVQSFENTDWSKGCKQLKKKGKFAIKSYMLH